ncbi:GNAT family N-acetyltransferase [Guptibacillus spartinae]|uniref:GNAT family N-acetyltransferase n=1 Tax=Guptibacillus spartinae TaxID=3025679 RepID=UPI00235F0160|nr:GNAT family N-acetyltransferase [Pseudalkalibacillus spartinae]
MIVVKKALTEHVNGIVSVCSNGYRDTYEETHAKAYIERVIRDFYNRDRILKEVTHTTREWNGWFVALDGDNVVGAIGGGMIGLEEGEVFVLYLDPNRKREGIGSKLLNELTKNQLQRGAREQWVSVSKGNVKGIPFYEAVGFRVQSEQESYSNLEEEVYTSLRYRRSL